MLFCNFFWSNLVVISHIELILSFNQLLRLLRQDVLIGLMYWNSRVSWFHNVWLDENVTLWFNHNPDFLRILKSYCLFCLLGLFVIWPICLFFLVWKYMKSRKLFYFEYVISSFIVSIPYSRILKSDYVCR